ncbi:hypothetical protein O8B93_20030 [Agrobacterium rhizogenes]|uniref:hypothetical protein n=1 Tax=Rhizobium rhizogenes TaxID=359 RepID=UPI0022B73A19|nr:hypothetical protein [Rhizobium rhizogenes]MCZ7449878.1 hypothetical protein [Rhizobium rhizogenes]
MSHSEENNNIAASKATSEAYVPPHRKHRRKTAALTFAAVGMLVVGAAAGAGAVRLTRPTPEMAPMTPVAISTVKEGNLVTLKGKVAEIFGNKFIVQDDSGRALIDTGPEGDDGKVVTVDEAVSIQGRFDNGVLHASYIVRQDGSIEALGPAGGPPRHGSKEDMMRGPKGNGPMDDLLPHPKP